MRIKSYFFISVLLFVLVGCKSKKETLAEQFENLNKYQEYVTEVTLTNKTSNRIKNMALTEIFLSGWEIVNTRFTDFGSFAENNVTHTDVRDDRANYYFDMKCNETKTFRILFNTSYFRKILFTRCSSRSDV